MNEEFRQRVDEIVARLAPGSRAEVAAELAVLLASGLDSVSALIEAVERRSDARSTICWLLGRLGDPAARDALRRAVRDDDASVRSEAVRALGDIGDDSDVEVLIDVLHHDSEPFVRAMAAAQLGMFAGRRAFEALAAALTRPGEDEDVRSSCAEALGTSEEPDALPLLLDALRDPSALVRYDAALALGHLGDTRALEPLRERLDHDDAEVPGVGSLRTIAAESIASIEARMAPGQRPGEPFLAFATRTLDNDLLEHAEYLIELVCELDQGELAPRQVLDIYPALWHEHDAEAWRISGPHPDVDVPAWTRANRRTAARVIAAWQRELERRMPDVERRPRVGWRLASGIDDWATGERIEIAMFPADDDREGFSFGLPEDPAPLADEERRALLTPRDPTPEQRG